MIDMMPELKKNVLNFGYSVQTLNMKPTYVNLLI